MLCLRHALNITAGPLGDGITHPSHLCEAEILHRLTAKPGILLIFMMVLHLACIYKKFQIWDQLEIRCAGCSTPLLTCGDAGLEQRSVKAPTGTTAVLL